MTVTPQQTAYRRDAVGAPDGALPLPGVPEPLPGAVSRTALINRLRTNHGGLVVVTAPGGYGKTTMLAQWARRDTRPVTWLDLDEQTDAKALAQGLALAAAPDDRASLRAALKSGSRAFVHRLGASLLAAREPGVIVLDGLDRVSDRRTLELVATLADRLPPQWQLVLAGRRTPSLPLAHHRAEGHLLELHAPDLRMSDREAASLMHTMGVQVDPAELDELQERTEGWAVGLYLCALTVQPVAGRSRRDPLSFNGAHHFVTEYLDEEVLARCEPELVSFAIEASVLERLTGPACDHVLGRSDSDACLSELADSQTFVVPLDRERVAFRFHGLFREALLARLQRRDPARLVELNRRAADWYAEAHDVPTALRHVREIGDRLRGVELLERMLPEVCAGRAGALSEGLDDLDDEQLLQEHQEAAVVGALVHAMQGRPLDSGRWIAAAERDDPDGASLTVVQAALARDGATQMREDATKALARLSLHSPLVPFACLLLGVAHVFAGDDALAEAAFLEASELAGHESPLVSCVALAELSLLAQDAEKWARAEELARAACDAAGELSEDAQVFAALAFAASARSALRNSTWVRAGDDLRRAHALLPLANEGLAWLAIQARVELTRAHLALNDVASASELVSELDRLLLSRPHLQTGAVRIAELHERIDALHETSRTGSTLTAAELRLLPLLTTHLTFRQIALHLYVSRNTIKTQSISVYRKLGVSSRTEAIDRAVELGLLRPEGEVLVARRS